MTSNLNPHYVVRAEGMRNTDYDATIYDGPEDLEHAKSIARAKASRDTSAWVVLHDHGGGHGERHVVAKIDGGQVETVDTECTCPPLPPGVASALGYAEQAMTEYAAATLPAGVERVDAALRAELDRRFGTPATDRLARATGAACPVKHGRCWHGNEAAECTLGHTAKDWAAFMHAQSTSAGSVDPS